jgi:hypothetical protein
MVKPQNKRKKRTMKKQIHNAVSVAERVALPEEGSQFLMDLALVRGFELTVLQVNRGYHLQARYAIVHGVDAEDVRWLRTPDDVLDFLGDYPVIRNPDYDRHRAVREAQAQLDKAALKALYHYLEGQRVKRAL